MMTLNNKLRLIALFLLSLMFTNCQQPSSDNANFYVGTYTNNESGSAGIYYYSLNEKNGNLSFIGLAGQCENPSFIALSADGRNLVSVVETAVGSEQSGMIASWEITDCGSLTALNQVASKGAYPCYTTVDDDGFVLCSNYGGGNAALYRLTETGISEALDVVQHEGSGPNAARQEGPHAHSVRFSPYDDRVFVADLGLDAVKVYTLDREERQLQPAAVPEIKMAPGSGPRHLAFHPDEPVMYVMNELNSTITAVELLSDGSFTVGASVTTLPEGFDGWNLGADIHITSDGRFLYSSNRGHNSLAIFALSADGKEVKPVGFADKHIATPRNFALSPNEQFVLVANQDGNSIVSFHRDPESGLLSYADEIEAPKPVCLAFEPQNCLW